MWAVENESFIYGQVFFMIDQVVFPHLLVEIQKRIVEPTDHRIPFKNCICLLSEALNFFIYKAELRSNSFVFSWNFLLGILLGIGSFWLYLLYRCSLLLLL